VSTSLHTTAQVHLYLQHAPAGSFWSVARNVAVLYDWFGVAGLVVADAEAGWSGAQLKVGDWLDCRDPTFTWGEAQVVEATDDTITVHFKGCPSSWDEALQRTDSERLAPHLSRTRPGQDQRVRRPQGMLWQVTPEEIHVIQSKVAAVIAGELDEEAAVRDVYVHFWFVAWWLTCPVAGQVFQG